MITTYLQWVAIAGLLALRLYDGRRIAKLEARADHASEMLRITDGAVQALFQNLQAAVDLSSRQTKLFSETLATVTRAFGDAV